MSVSAADQPVLDVPVVGVMDPLPLMALLFGLVGLAGNMFAGLAVMCGVCSLWPVLQRPGLARGHGLAVAGLVLGGVGMLVMVMVGVFLA